MKGKWVFWFMLQLFPLFFLFWHWTPYVNAQHIIANWFIELQFSFTYRYTDDVLSLKNTNLQSTWNIHLPTWTWKKKQRRLQHPTHTWIVISTLTNLVLATRPFEKRDVINFPIVTFPSLSKNTPSALTYWVYVLQLT